MASKKKTRPGYEPARGQPDPDDAAPGAFPIGHLTHFPASNGPVCGLKPTPTQAADYDPAEPTCPTCAKWLAATRAHTAARYPWTQPGYVAPAPEPATKSETKE